MGKSSLCKKILSNSFAPSTIRHVLTFVFLGLFLKRNEISEKLQYFRTRNRGNFEKLDLATQYEEIFQDFSQTARYIDLFSVTLIKLFVMVNTTYK